jgi:hypothetical protein
MFVQAGTPERTNCPMLHAAQTGEETALSSPGKSATPPCPARDNPQASAIFASPAHVRELLHKLGDSAAWQLDSGVVSRAAFVLFRRLSWRPAIYLSAYIICWRIRAA